MPTAPPIGLRPRRFALEDRYREVMDAFRRYIGAGKAPPLEWAAELGDIARELMVIDKEDR